MSAKERATMGLVVIAVGCALVSTILHVRREFFSGTSAVSVQRPSAVEVPDWQEYAKLGHRRGPVDAPVTIIEFADFECPACQHFAGGALPAILKQYGTQVAHVFRHWPLPRHRFAYPAARAAVCAGQQGKFDEFHDAIYAFQDSLGLVPFSRVAAAVGTPDTVEFLRCYETPGKVPRIEEDIAAAKALGALGTPTVLVNGLMLPGTPDSATLAGAVEKALAARNK